MSYVFRLVKIVVALALALVMSIPSAYADPTELDPPVLVSSDVTPTVDVTNAAALVTVTVQLSDATGVEPPTVWFGDPDIYWQTESAVMTLHDGTSTAGTWRATFTVAARSSEQVVRVYLDVVTDELGNSSSSPVIIGSVTVVNDPDDEAPLVGDVAITPSSVDVTDGAQTVTVTVALTDESGVIPSTVYAAPPRGSRQPSVLMSLVSGTRTSGTWSASVSIPKDATEGYWSVGSDGFTDILGNESSSRALGTFLVTREAAEIDPPVLVSGAVTPTVDVTNAAAVVTVTVQLSDASGVKPPTVWFGDPDIYWQTKSAVMTLQEGTSTAGTWKATFTVAARTDPQLVRVYLDVLSDALGNTTSTPVIIGTVNVVNAPDKAAPVVGATKVTPSLVDSTIAIDTITVTMELTDVSGAIAPVVEVDDPDGYTILTQTMQLLSGTNKSGTWVAYFHADYGLEPGDWTYWVGSVTDVLGNTKVGWVKLGTQRSLAPLPASGIFGEHTGDAYADVYGVDKTGRLKLIKGGPSTMSLMVDYGTTMVGVTYLVQIGDWSGDKRSDVLARRADHSLWIYTSTPSGGLVPWRQVGKNWGSMDKIIFAGSLNGSANKYVVARQASTGDLYRYQITANGLVGVAKIGQNWNGMKFFFSVGDFNGDGRGDIIGVRSSDGTMWFYPGRTDGKLDYGRQVGRGWGNFQHAFSPGDFSGDGRFDLLGVDGNGVLWGYHNTGAGWSYYKKMGVGYSGYLLLA